MKRFFLLLLLGIPTVQAQDEQVPFDEPGKHWKIDSRGEKWTWFTDYQGFQEARLFKTPEGEFFLEIYYRSNDKIFRIRKPLGREELQTLRTQLSYSQMDEREFDRDGRIKLLITSTAAGALVYGFTIPIAMNVQSSSSAVGLYMVITGSSFYLPYQLTKNMNVSDGAATMHYFGTTRGLLHGLFIGNIFSGNKSSGRSAAGFASAVSVSEAWGGFYLARHWQPGRSEIIGNMGDVGLLCGGLFSAANGYDDRARKVGSSFMTGAIVGIGTGYWLSKQSDFTRGDAYVLRDASYLGGLGALAVSRLFQWNSTSGQSYTTMAGMGTGTALGYQMVQYKNFSTSQGIYITLAESAGFLLGTGISYMIEKKDIYNSRIALPLGFVGATAGYYGMYSIQSTEQESKTSSSNLNYFINPLPMISKAARRHQPMLNLSYQF